MYDQNLTFRNAIGIREIPTTILLNPQGELVLATSEIIKSQGNLRAMLDYATKGRGKATEDYVSKNLLVSDGSVKQSVDSAKKSTQAQSIDVYKRQIETAPTSLLPGIAQIRCAASFCTITVREEIGRRDSSRFMMMGEVM